MRWLYANLGYKITALVVAALLWGVAHTSSPVQRGFDVPVVLRDIPEGLVVTERSADEINVRIMGNRGALRSLSAGELVYELPVEGAKPGRLTVDVAPETALDRLPRGARVVSHSPALLELQFATRGTKTVRVKGDVTGEPAQGFVMGDIVLEPDRIKITGAQSEVLRLREVLTETIDVSGAVEDIERDVRIALGKGNVWVEREDPVKVRIPIAAEIVEEAESGEETG